LAAVVKLKFFSRHSAGGSVTNVFLGVGLGFSSSVNYLLVPLFDCSTSFKFEKVVFSKLELTYPAFVLLNSVTGLFITLEF